MHLSNNPTSSLWLSIRAHGSSSGFSILISTNSTNKLLLTCVLSIVGLLIMAGAEFPWVLTTQRARRQLPGNEDDCTHNNGAHTPLCILGLGTMVILYLHRLDRKTNGLDFEHSNLLLYPNVIFWGVQNIIASQAIQHIINIPQRLGVTAHIRRILRHFHFLARAISRNFKRETLPSIAFHLQRGCWPWILVLSVAP